MHQNSYYVQIAVMLCFFKLKHASFLFKQLNTHQNKKNYNILLGILWKKKTTVNLCLAHRKMYG